MTQEEVERAFARSTLGARIRRGVPQGQAKRQHFTPQLLLRRFLAPGENRLCQLDVTSGRPQQVSVSSAASRRRFYTLTDSETLQRDETIEGLLGVVESDARPAIETIVHSPSNLTADQRVTLSYFAAAQLVRTPSALARMQAISRVVHVAEMARLVTDDATFGEVYSAVREGGNDDDPAWLQRWMREALLDDRIRLANQRELSLSTMLDLVDDYAVRLFCMPWSLLSPTAGSLFITSDSGLGVIDGARDDFQQVSVFGSSAARVCLPLARSHCLQAGPINGPTFSVASRTLSSDDTLVLNLAVYGWAARHIFADSQKTATDVRRAAKSLPDVARGPRSYRQYVLIERDPDDDTIAAAHRKVGRVPYVEHEGRAHDYVILRDDKDLARGALRAMAISKSRAERRTGTSDLRSGSEVLSPLDIRRSWRSR